MSTPEELEAERAELDDALEEAIYAWHDDHKDLMSPNTPLDVIAPALAAIRRHAAATALRGQAQRLNRAELAYIKRAKNHKHGTRVYDVDMAYAQQARAEARNLRRAADDVIAEGWEHACAQTTPATREDPAEGCEEPVENEGDYCPKHEGGPDE